MKNRTIVSCVCVIVACLLVCGIQMLFNRSTSREATAQEIEAHKVYAVDWTAVPGWEDGMTEKEFILSLCTFVEEKEIGSNIHRIYASDTLIDYLYRGDKLTEISELDGVLYLTYHASDEDMIIIAYNDEGMMELGVYDGQSDTLYHQLDGTVTVWEKFRNGIQFG